MWQVRFTPQAERDLARLDKAVAQRILDKIRWLATHFEAVPHEPLRGPWKGVYKLRVGDYRVIYTFSREPEPIVWIRLIGHRREIYKL